MITTGYDLIMVIWGLIFIAAATLFIVVMNRVFQFEERRQDSLTGSTSTSPPSIGQTH